MRLQDLCDFPECSQCINPSDEIITAAGTSRFSNYMILCVLLLVSFALIELPEDESPVTGNAKTLCLL